MDYRVYRADIRFWMIVILLSCVVGGCVVVLCFGRLVWFLLVWCFCLCFFVCGCLGGLDMRLRFSGLL